MQHREFKIKPYSKRELAQLYFPEELPHTAVKKFMYWVNTTPGLLKSLKQLNYDNKNRNLTPKQVRIIVEYLDTP